MTDLCQIIALQLLGGIKNGLAQHRFLDGMGKVGAISGEDEAVGLVVILQ